MRRAVRWWVCAFALVLGLQGILAMPASAAGSFTDNGDGTVTLTYSNVNANYGWIVCTGTTPASSCNMTNLVGRIGFTQSTGMVPPGSSPVTIAVGTSYYSWLSSSVTTLASGSYTFAYWDNNDMSTGVASIGNVTIANLPPNNSSSSSATSAPASVVQQFGKPTTGTCTDAASDELNWGGSSSGGWSESWAQWMNGGNGGAVCTRTLVYSTSSGGWAAS